MRKQFSTFPPGRLASVTAILAALVMPAMAWAADNRGAQHGIDLVQRPSGGYWMIWSSSGGNPPTSIYDHDVYRLPIDPRALENVNIDDAQMLIGGYEAQEPVSAAIADDGHIMLTLEDGGDGVQNVVAQRYAVYDENLETAVVPYPTDVYDGGHSGHVAAVGNRFVVFWSNDWTGEGQDGVCELGSGMDVIATIYDSKGNRLKFQGEDQGELGTEVATGPERDWWPYVAGSSSRAAVLWQRFVEGEIYADLYYAVIDPETGAMVKRPTLVETNVEYYNYSLEYVEAIDRFLIRGNYHEAAPEGSACDVVVADRGFGYLIDNNGDVTASNIELAPIVRESQSIVRNDCDNRALVVQPRYPNGLSLLNVTPSSIEASPAIEDDTQWDYIGTDGFFATPTSVFVASLSTDGLLTKVFEGIAEPLCDDDRRWITDRSDWAPFQAPRSMDSRAVQGWEPENRSHQAPR